MPKLPKSQRLSYSAALSYIAKCVGKPSLHNDVVNALHRALCEGDISAEGQYHLPMSSIGENRNQKTLTIAPEVWQQYDATKTAFLPRIHENKYQNNSPFYDPVTIATADVDAWLNIGQNAQMKVSAVTDKIYKERIKKALADDMKFSRDEDRTWGKTNGYSIESVDAARIKFAPKEWQKQGRVPTQKETAKETAE